MKTPWLWRYLLLAVFAITSANAAAFTVEFDFDIIDKEWENFDGEGPAGEGTITVELPDEVKDNEVRLQTLIFKGDVYKQIQKSKDELHDRIDKLNEIFPTLAPEQQEEALDTVNKEYKDERKSLEKSINKTVKKIWKKYTKELDESKKKVRKSRIKIAFTSIKNFLKIGSSVTSAAASGGAAIPAAVLVSLSAVYDLYKEISKYNQTLDKAGEDMQKALESYNESMGEFKETIDSNSKDWKEKVVQGTIEGGSKLATVIAKGSEASVKDWVAAGFKIETSALDPIWKALKPAGVKLEEKLNNYEEKLAFARKKIDKLGREVTSLIKKMDGVKGDSKFAKWAREKGVKKDLSTALDGALTTVVTLQENIEKYDGVADEVQEALDDAEDDSINNAYKKLNSAYDITKNIGGIFVGIMTGNFVSVAEKSVGLIEAGIKSGAFGS